jgi:UDP-glucose 4-epimerase
MQKVFISGVGGFIGRHLARFFTGRGCLVYGLDTITEEQAPLTDLKAYHHLQLPSAELTSVLTTTQPEVFVHCAGRASVPLSMSDPRSDYLSGPVLTWEVLDALRRSAPECKFIFLSSAAVYGCPLRLPVKETDPVNPISPYGAHKLQAELVCREFASLFGIPSASARIFSAYGPGLRRQVVWDLCHQAITRHKIEAQGTGGESRDFMHVKDICEAVALLAEKAPLQGEVYNFGSSEETKISDLSTCIVESLGKECTIHFSGQVPQGTPLNWQADISELTALGFKPQIGIAEGVRSYMDWCKAELSIA